MTINAPSNEQQKLSLNGENIEIVDDFKYLGSLVASSKKDIKIRKGQAWGAFWKMKQIWKANNISIDTKVRLFKSSCLSILLYGCETWIITADFKRELCYKLLQNHA